MTHEQGNRFNKIIQPYLDDDGKLVIDGAAQDSDSAAGAISCLDDAAMEQLLDDLGTQAAMLYCLAHNPFCAVPEDIPSKDARPTFYVTCSSGGHSHTYFKWE